MYIKEIKAPDGYYRNDTVYPVSTSAGVTTSQEVRDDRVKATIHLVKKDAETGSVPQGDYFGKTIEEIFYYEETSS